MSKKDSKANSEIIQRMQILCSKRERCTSEIRKKLAGYNIPAQETERIIEILLKDNFINDERYAISFAHDKFRFNKWGRIKIEYQLKRFGLGDNYILKALGSIDSNEYLNMIKSELSKKLKKEKSSDTYMLKSKLMRFGQSKGFETELVFNILDEILSTKR
ncbi:MAG: RecX family transcriptional regulator [Bacteroidales bacterium]|nr:MAG: RecX family transcriptional regulator [Bacteroidales bacterium]